jgi:hypothetical protein
MTRENPDAHVATAWPDDVVIAARLGSAFDGDGTQAGVTS